LKCSHIYGNIRAKEKLEVMIMRYIGVRELKESFVTCINSGEEIVITKRKKPIARISPIKSNSPESALLEIGRVLTEAGINQKDASRVLKQVRKELYG